MEKIKEVIGSIIENADKELLSKTKEELEQYWFFKYDKNSSVNWNLYEFTKYIELYKHHCERWEEHHNGHICVVERVRNNYLIPKIKAFTEIAKTMWM